MAGSRKTEYELAMEVGGKVAESFGSSVREVNCGFDAMANMAKSASKMIAVAFSAVKVGGFVTDAVEAYSEFEQSMANTAAVANATKYEYGQLEQAARDMGKATTKTAAEAADALGYMMLAGWDVGEAISGLEPVLRLSEATQMDLATCSDLVTDSMSALGLSVDGLSGYLDICTAANNSANTSAEALMEAFIGCGGSARTVGADLNDTATALGILANNGTKGAEAGRALNSMLVRMTSKDAAMDAMRDLGVAVFNDAGEFRGLQNVLVDVQQALSGLTAEQQASYMASIAGTNYYTEMSYLLASVASNAEDSASCLQAAGLEGEALEAALAAAANGSMSAWDELSESLGNSDGALMNMADTVTDTLQGAFLRLESAADDAKISFADAFSDDLKGMVNGLAGFIPTLTQEFIDFSTKAGPKISKAFRLVQKGAEKAWNVVTGLGEGFMDNLGTVETVISGIGGAIVGYKVVSGLAKTATAIKGVSAAAKAFAITNPWLLGITAAITAIAGITAAVKAAERQAVKSNLAEHFGDIALSMEEISQTAEYIIASDNLSKMHESMMAFGELDGIADSLQDSINAINKMNWKVSIGMELSADDRDSYEAEIQNYIAQAQNYVEQERYALSINLALFADGDLERQNIVTQLDNFYADKYTELEDLGTQLNEAVTAAFNDGLLEPDEVKVITEIQAKMAKIQEALATSDFEAKLKVMELQYSGAELDADSFKALQEELAAQVQAAGAEYEESLQLRIANYQAMLNDGAISQSEYDFAVNEFWEDHLASMAELETKALSFQLNTIEQTYGDEVSEFKAHMTSVMDEYISDDYSGQWEQKGASLLPFMAKDIFTNDIDVNTKKSIESLLDSMQPLLEQAEKTKQMYADLGRELSGPEMENLESINKVLSSANMLGAMTAYKGFVGQKGDLESVYAVLSQGIASDERYSELETMLREYADYLPQAFAEGLEASRPEEAIAPAVDGMYAQVSDCINKAFSQGFDVAADVTLELKAFLPDGISLAQADPAVPGLSAGMPGLAEGGIYDSPFVTWFAEDGPEAAIPLDGSSRAVSLWERAGKLLGVFDGGIKAGKGEEIYNSMAACQTTNDNSIRDDSTDSRQFVFSPQITIEGSASREDVEGALNISMDQFRELFEQLMAEKARVSFG